MVVGLIFDALFGMPVTLCREVLLKVKDEVDREMLVTEESVKLKLQQLQIMLQDGELSEEEYEALEANLMEKLRAARESLGKKG